MGPATRQCHLVPADEVAAASAAAAERLAWARCAESVVPRILVAADVHDPECVDGVPAVRLVTCPWVHARAQQPRLSPA